MTRAEVLARIAAKDKRYAPAVACPNRGGVVGTVACRSCRGRVELKVYQCAAHPEGCTVGRKVEGHHQCR